MRWVMRLVVAGALLAPWPLASQTPCESEIGPLRWLVQKYASERTQLEFALATSEARRQAGEERLKQMDEALKKLPGGQTPGR